MYAHSHHHRNKDNPGNFEDSMEEPIRLVIALAPACGPCTSKLVSSKTPRLHFSVGTADSWLPRSIIGVYQIFAHVCAKVVICLEGLEFFLREERTQTLEKQWRDGTPSPALFLVSVSSCLALSSLLELMWPMLEQASTPTAQLNSRESLSPFVSLVRLGMCPLGSQGIDFFVIQARC